MYKISVQSAVYIYCPAELCNSALGNVFQLLVIAGHRSSALFLFQCQVENCASTTVPVGAPLPWIAMVYESPSICFTSVMAEAVSDVT